MPTGHAQIAGMATAVPPITATVDEVWDALGRSRGRRMPKLQGDEGARTRNFAQPLTSLMETPISNTRACSPGKSAARRWTGVAWPPRLSAS